MLQAPPELVSVRELRILAVGNQSAISQPRHADQCMRRAQPLIAATESKLQRLYDEFNFANSAATELYIEAFVASLALNVDFLFRKMNTVERRCDADRP